MALGFLNSLIGLAIKNKVPVIQNLVDRWRRRIEVGLMNHKGKLPDKVAFGPGNASAKVGAVAATVSSSSSPQRTE